METVYVSYADAKTVKCPKCDAVPDAPCIMVNRRLAKQWAGDQWISRGNPIRRAHQERIEAYREIHGIPRRPTPAERQAREPERWEHALSDADAKRYLKLGITGEMVVRLRWPDISEDAAAYVLWEFTPYPLVQGIHDLADAIAAIDELELEYALSQRGRARAG